MQESIIGLASLTANSLIHLLFGHVSVHIIFCYILIL